MDIINELICVISKTDENNREGEKRIIILIIIKWKGNWTVLIRLSIRAGKSNTVFKSSTWVNLKLSSYLRPY